MRRHGIASFDELLRRSTERIDWFWDTIIRDELKLRFETPYSSVVDLSPGIARPRWCVGGEMNIVTNLLDRYDGTPTDDNIALRAEHEDGSGRTYTYQQLRRAANKAANALRSLGIQRGDRVGVFMPMRAECVIAMLAIIKVGGIFLPLFSGYGASAVASRLRDADAVALFTTDVCHRRGKVSSIKSIANEAAAQVPTLRHMIVLRRSPQDCLWVEGRDHWWQDLVDRQSDVAHTERTGADEPMMLIYTSGTTGKPKGAVHTHCGFPVKAAQDMLHGMDLHADETMWWMTDMGWMMGPWLVFGTLLLGATMLVYDGAPDYPEVDRVWSIVQRHRVTMLGLSPTFVRAIAPHGEGPVRKHDLSSLRKFASTGEPWNPTAWLWLFNAVGQGRLPIINYSGGTEISGGILCGNVLTAQKPCAFAGPLPGIAADVVDESGQSLPAGQVGELVIRRPWIGMTRGFWKDDGDRRYLDAYWSRFGDTWVHGDWAVIDEDGLWYILGRSDDTIKVAGKRLGPAEVESILVRHPEVKEAAAIGVPDEVKGQVVVCFCVLKSFDRAGDALRAELRGLLEHELGKALLPKEIRFVRDLPKTRNAKVMRRVIRAAYLGQDPGDTSSLENAAAVDEIRNAR
jgi:acetyl-CoA synthetase